MRTLIFFLCLLVTSVAGGENFSAPRNVVALVLVHTQNSANSGSAVLIAEDTWLTSAHLFTNHSGSVEVFTRNGKREGRLLKIDPKNDLALFTAKASCPCATFASSPAVLDEEVLVVGFPYPGALRTQIATIGHIQGMIDDNMQVSSAHVAPGMSGGGWFVFRNNRWELVGITKAILAVPGDFMLTIPVYWLSFSVPLPTIYTFLTTFTQNPANPSVVAP